MQNTQRKKSMMLTNLLVVFCYECGTKDKYINKVQAKKCTKKCDAHAKMFFCQSKPIGLLLLLLLLLSSLLKLPIGCSQMNLKIFILHLVTHHAVSFFFLIFFFLYSKCMNLLWVFGSQPSAVIARVLNKNAVS